MPEDLRLGSELQAVVEALRRRTEACRLLDEQAADGVLVFSPRGRVVDASVSAATLLGCSRADLRKLAVDDLLPDGGDPILELEAGQSLTRECRLPRRDGRVIEAELRVRRVPDGRLQAVVRDLTERRRAAEALRQSEERYRTLAGDAPYAVLVAVDGEVAFANPAAERLLGGPKAGALAGRTLLDLVHPDDRPALREGLVQAAGAGRGGTRLSFRLRRADRSMVEVEGVATPVDHGRRSGIQVLMRNEEAPAAEASPSALYKDSLTGLTSALLVADRLSVALIQAYRSRTRVGVIVIDLDRFGAFNDALGHPAGDRLLRAVARRLSACVREGDTVARLQADAFALLLPGLRHPDDAGRVAEKVLKALRKPFPLRERVAQVTASAGVSVFPEDGDDGDALLRQADEAMRQARTAGGDRAQAQAAEPVKPGIDPLELEVGIRAALGRGKMSLDGVPAQPGVLFYQPFYSVETGKVVGVEALLRWQHPHLGLVFPQDFLSKADFAGLILAIGPWILHTAAQQARAWQKRGNRNLRLAVNLSTPEMLRHDLVEQVRAALEESGLLAKLLQVEVPEGHVMQDLERTARTLRRLRDLGVTVVLDRFGLGYSSLSRLAELPLDGLKVDLSFQHRATPNSDDASLLTAVIAVARSLKLRVAAQGVETEGQMAMLRRLGCDEVQGYLLSPPVPAAEIPALLSKQTEAPHQALALCRKALAPSG